MVSRTTLKVFPAEQSIIIQGFHIPESKFESLLTPSPQYSHNAGTWILPTTMHPLLLAGKLFISYLSKEFQITVHTSTSESIVSCTWDNVPAGLGEPCFDKFQAVLCKELLKIPSAYSFEIGSGFAGTTMLGSDHNDVFTQINQVIKPASNNAGGVLGGITTGSPICFKLGLKSLTPDTEDLIQSISSVIVLDFLTIQKIRKLLP